MLRVRIQFHLLHQQRAFERIESFFVCLKSSTQMGLEEAAMNQAPVGLENGADRAATSRENPVLSTLPIDPESYCVVLRRAKTGISAKRHDELVARNNQRRGRNYGTKKRNRKLLPLAFIWSMVRFYFRKDLPSRKKHTL